jgi:hypothetical protein
MMRRFAGIEDVNMEENNVSSFHLLHFGVLIGGVNKG